MKLPCALAILLTVTATPAAELTDTQKESILKRLDELINRRAEGATSGSKRAITALRAAATSSSSAVALYEASVRSERFERDDKKVDFADWKKRHSNLYRSKAFATCLRAQLSGLAVALEVAEVEKLKPDKQQAAFLRLLPSIHEFLDLASVGKAQMDATTANVREIFRGDLTGMNFDGAKKYLEGASDDSIFDSVIAKAYNISAYIKKPEGFPNSISDARSATDSFILQRLYEFGELPPIDEAWDKHIARLAAGVNYYKDEKLIARSKDLFEEELPLARWAQARDRFTYGDDKVSGASAMLDVIKSHLDHEFCPTWIGEFRELVAEDEAGTE